MDNTTLLCSLVQFHELLDLIKNDEYTLLGPRIRNQVIIYDELSSSQDLPIGWTDEQEPGHYRLKRRNDNAYFGYNLGPHSWKQFLFPPHEKLFSAKKNEKEISVSDETDPPIQKMAFIGVHPCEIEAMRIQDKVFNNQVAVYRQYQQRRDSLFILAVQCTHSVNTCFCTSMGTGPEAKDGYDLAVTEIVDSDHHYFLLDIGTEKGRSYCQRLQLKPAGAKECQLARDLITKNKENMKRSVDADHVHEMLLNSWDYKRWDQVSKRCVNCTNCTMVCPTCFCSETTDHSTINGKETFRCQSWDSCFTLSHSYIHGGCIRQSAKSRYRQWLTHKFGTWHDQFGLSGCVGCGRCITWCPVGIDVTEELHELYADKLNNWNLARSTLEIQDHRNSPGYTQGDGDGLQARDVGEDKTNSSTCLGIQKEVT